MTAPRRRRSWSRVVLRPHVLVALLLVGSGVAWIWAAATASAPVRPPANLLLGQPRPVPETTDVPIVVVDRDGLRRTLLVEVEVVAEVDARLRAALTALREALVAEGNWPPTVAAPYVQSYEARRRRVVVLDVPALREGPGLELMAELAALRSLEETALAHGADEVRVVVDGTPAASLWGQVALR